MNSHHQTWLSSTSACNVANITDTRDVRGCNSASEPNEPDRAFAARTKALKLASPNKRHVIHLNCTVDRTKITRANRETFTLFSTVTISLRIVQNIINRIISNISYHRTGSPKIINFKDYQKKTSNPINFCFESIHNNFSYLRSLWILLTFFIGTGNSKAIPSKDIIVESIATVPTYSCCY